MSTTVLDEISVALQDIVQLLESDKKGQAQALATALAEAMKNAPRPVVNVQAPQVTVEAPKAPAVKVSNGWKFKMTYDRLGYVTEMTAEKL